LRYLLFIIVHIVASKLYNVVDVQLGRLSRKSTQPESSRE